MFRVSKVDTLFHVSEDSWLQISPNGHITYRLNSRFVHQWNRAITTIGQDAARIAASYTPFSFFRGAWDSKFSYASRGMVSDILIHNKFIGSKMPYLSKYSNKKRFYYFPGQQAIAMLESGRRTGYTITPRRAKALTVAPYTRANGKPSYITEDGISFAKEVTIRGGFFRYEPVTNAEKYLKTEINNFFANLRSSGVNKASYSSNFQYKRGNFRGGTGKATSGKSTSESATKAYKSKHSKNFRARRKNFRSGGDEE